MNHYCELLIDSRLLLFINNPCAQQLLEGATVQIWLGNGLDSSIVDRSSFAAHTGSFILMYRVFLFSYIVVYCHLFYLGSFLVISRSLLFLCVQQLPEGGTI
jgi:hypothetical protein